MKAAQLTPEERGAAMGPIVRAWAREYAAAAPDISKGKYKLRRTWVDRLVEAGHLPLQGTKNPDRMDIDEGENGGTRQVRFTREEKGKGRIDPPPSAGPSANPGGSTAGLQVSAAIAIRCGVC